MDEGFRRIQSYLIEGSTKTQQRVYAKFIGNEPINLNPEEKKPKSFRASQQTVSKRVDIGIQDHGTDEPAMDRRVPSFILNRDIEYSEP